MKKLLPVALMVTLAGCANAQEVQTEQCLATLGAVRQATAVTADESTVTLAFDDQKVILTGPDTINVRQDYARGLALVGIEDDRGMYRVIYQTGGFCAAYSQFQVNNS